MKIKLLSVVLLVAVVVVGLAACGGKEDKKSSECSILSFSVGSVAYKVEGTSITYLYPKTAGDTWTGLPTWPAKPTITISDKASIEPSPDKEQNFVTGASYTVTAEDGSKKTYNVKATLGSL